MAKATAQQRTNAVYWHGNLCYAAESRAEKVARPPVLACVEIVQLVRDVCAAEQIPPVTVEFMTGRHHTRGHAVPSKRVIKLPRSGVKTSLVLHEIAHLADGAANHGPVFRSGYLRLCRAYAPRYARSLAVAFRYYGIEVDESAD